MEKWKAQKVGTGKQKEKGSPGVSMSQDLFVFMLGSLPYQTRWQSEPPLGYPVQLLPSPSATTLNKQRQLCIFSCYLSGKGLDKDKTSHHLGGWDDCVSCKPRGCCLKPVGRREMGRGSVWGRQTAYVLLASQQGLYPFGSWYITYSLQPTMTVNNDSYILLCKKSQYISQEFYKFQKVDKSRESCRKAALWTPGENSTMCGQKPLWQKWGLCPSKKSKEIIMGILQRLWSQSPWKFQRVIEVWIVKEG